MNIGRDIKKIKKADFESKYAELSEELKTIRQLESASVEQLENYYDILSDKESKIEDKQIDRANKIDSKFESKKLNRDMRIAMALTGLYVGIVVFLTPIEGILIFSLLAGIALVPVLVELNLRGVSRINDFIRTNLENKKLEQIDKTKRTVCKIKYSKENKQVLSAKLEKEVEDLKATQPPRFAVLKKITGIKNQKDTKQEKPENTQPKSELEHERV